VFLGKVHEALISLELFHKYEAFRMLEKHFCHTVPGAIIETKPACPGTSMTDRHLLSCLALLIAACGAQAPEPPGADTVFTNGRIYTVAADRGWAQAVAITDGRIVFVGSNDDAANHIGGNTSVTDLGGRMMLPAFQDSHIHPIGAGIEASSCNLNELDDLAAYRAVIGEYAAANPDVEWITGGGWSMSVFGPGGRPSKTIIDELVQDRPVYLSSADGHTGWANSRAGDRRDHQRHAGSAGRHHRSRP
jgi:predicted amidohydrolase YtcJ